MPLGSRKSSGLFKIVAKDALITLSAEFVLLVSFFVFYRLLADRFGTEGVGEYSLMRRVLAVLIPIALLGLPEALGRYIAGATEERERSGLIAAGLVIMVATTAILGLVLNMDENLSARWVFGDVSYENLILPFTVLLVGLGSHTFVYSCLRGSLQIKALNSMQLLNLGVFPLILILVAHKLTFSTLIILLGAGHVVTAAVFFIVAVPSSVAMKVYPRFVRKLLRFGAPRLIATFAYAAMLSLVPMGASHYVSISEVGYLSLSIALLIGVGNVVSPLGSVLLPHVSGLVGRGEVERFERVLYLLIGAVLQTMLFLAGQFMVFVDYVLTIWMGSTFLPAAPIMAVTFSALIAFGFFAVTRNILDAVSTKALNSINAAISLGVLILAMVVIIILRPLGDVTLMFAVAFAFAFNLLGVLTYLSVRKIFTFKLQEDIRHLLWGVVLNAGAVGFALLVKDQVTTNIFLFVIFQAALLAIYVVVLRLLNFEWLKIIESKIFLPK